jgi:dihydrofolate synthase/folylpolyglutamate synthase
MTFDESLKYLLSLGNEVSSMKLGLENIRRLLDALGHPENNFLKVQVAGTNGKGSVCVFLDSICRAAGCKTGLFTSPHLISITERIKIDGVEISEEDFARHATKIREIAESEFDVPPTFFEQVTAIALSAFAEGKIELAILETGLGGRLDAVTAANAEFAGITPIDLDHQQYLGKTVEEIAAEKAGIIHKNSDVAIAPQRPEAAEALLKRCREFGIEPIFSGSEIYPEVQLKIFGRHQVINAALAASIAELLQQFDSRIIKEKIVEGLETAVHPGRLEYRSGILFDGAHNPAGARALAAYLDEFVKKPVTLIFGAMEDKDLANIADILFPKVRYVVLTRADNPRSAAPEELLKLVPAAFKKDNVFPAKNVNEALEIARKITKDEGLICVAGSLYLVGEAQKTLES